MSSYNFELKDFDAGGRIGVFTLNGKKMTTPTIFPVVNPFNNLISPRKLYDHFGAECLFTNAYILYQKREKFQDIIEKGLHQHLDFPGIIATDSGGFQDYMYAGDIKIKPEVIEAFQEKIGSDCPVILDIPVQTTDEYDVAKEKVDITIQRAKDNITRRTRTDTAWFGPIHGSVYPDLLKHSTLEMSKLNYGIYAIGGIVKTFNDYRFDLDVEILLQVRENIDQSKVLHMFGLGLPSFFSLAVACGADTFDSAAYILFAKDDRYFTLTGTKNIQDLSELPCNCPICTKYSAQEIQKLPKTERIEALALHNLYLTYSELRTIRQAIREGTLWDLVEQRVNAHPKLIKALKKAQEYPKYFRNMLNFNKTKGIRCLNQNSFYREHFEYFRNNANRFSIPINKSDLIFLPEFEMAGINSRSMKHIVKNLKKSHITKNSQIIILSNTLGIIPLELSQMYPAGQRDGALNFIPSTKQAEIILQNVDSFVKHNEQNIKTISILLAENFVDEYGVLRDFPSKYHVISYILEGLQAQKSKVQIKTFVDIETLVAHYQKTD